MKLIKTSGRKAPERQGQREKIRAMDEQILSHNTAGFPPNWAKRLWIGLTAVFMALPVQFAWKDTAFWILLIWVLSAPNYYIMRYLSFTEEKKTALFADKYRYLPIDKEQVILVRVGYLLDFLKKNILVSFITQLAMSLLITHRITIWNILYVLVFAGILPFAVSLLSIRFSFR